MKKWKIYLDMDGVLCYFEKKFVEMFDHSPKDSRSNKQFSPEWEIFVKQKSFEKLDWFPGSKELLQYIRSTKLPVEILSSSGGQKFHGEVTAQKIHWLRNHGIQYKANIVPGRKHKKDFATPHSILIDDTDDIIDDFNKAGGIGILHKNAEETLKTLKKILETH